MSATDLDVAFAEGVAHERERVSALAKLLRPESYELIVRALEGGCYVDQILDEYLALFTGDQGSTEPDVLQGAVTRALAGRGHGPRARISLYPDSDWWHYVSRWFYP